MFRTAEQRDVIAQLHVEYGMPDRTMHERTDEPYGLVWLRWHKASISSDFPDRNLFVRPDGTRLTWELLF